MQAEMPAGSAEQRTAIARRVEMGPGGPVATEIAVREIRPAGTPGAAEAPVAPGVPVAPPIQFEMPAVSGALVGTMAPRTPSPGGDDRSIAPYAPLRRRGSIDVDGADDLRQELDARLQRELAWEQNVQQQVTSFMENERGMARAAVHELRTVGAEAIEFESERARARVAESQERARELAAEVQLARHGELRGESRLRQVEQVAKAQLDNQQRELLEVGVVQGRQRDHMAAAVRHELVQAQGQRDHQHAVALHAQAVSHHAQQEYELMRQANHESQMQVLRLRSEMQEQAAQVEQLKVMLQQMMQQGGERRGGALAEMSARAGDDSSSSPESSAVPSGASAQQFFPGLYGRPAQGQSANLRQDDGAGSQRGSLPGGIPVFHIGEGPPETEARQSETGGPPRVGGAMTATKRSGEDKKPRREEAEIVKLQALPRAPEFRSWKMAVRNEIAGASGAPHTAFVGL